MSAFYVGTDHINAMLTILQHTGYNSGRNGYWIDKPTRAQLTDLGKVLIAENLKSLEYRYPTDPDNKHNGGEVEGFTYEPDLRVMSDMSTRTMSDLFLCYEYQACEHDAFEQSWAQRIVNGAIKSIARRNPEQKHISAWPYQRDKKQPKMVLLSEPA